MPRVDRMVTGDDIPTDPDSRTFGLVRSALGRELGLQGHLLALVRRGVAVAAPPPP